MSLYILKYSIRILGLLGRSADPSYRMPTIPMSIQMKIASEIRGYVTVGGTCST